MEFLLEALIESLKLIVGFDPEVYTIVATSLTVSLVAVAMAALVGTPLGAAIALGRFPGRGAVLLALNTLMATPTVAVGLLLYAVLTRHGMLGDFHLLYTRWGIVLGEFVLATPIVANLTLTAVSALDPRLMLTCKSLGTTRIQRMRIALSEARSAVMAALIVAFGRLIGEVGIAMIVGGNIKGFTRTITTAIALQTSRGEFELGMALGILLLVVALAVNAVLYRLQQSAEQQRSN